ncbi:unnamed protein product [Trichogramma brassicae]|uniref:Reverse transcriptase RNase H-like domain-containing protein n=1 Tax=Trichogramma brassicae TaxID=86971 RepID=A0A6H5I4P7_9HYME|nr:unnamed protein product [Trichogramma brassicae]
MAPVALVAFDTVDKKAVRIARPVSGEANSASPAERIDKIMQSLALEGLNSEEIKSVREIVSKFPFQFHLPLDKLSLTGSGAHRIVTSDDIPINIKQYRHPPHLRDEMRTRAGAPRQRYSRGIRVPVQFSTVDRAEKSRARRNKEMALDASDFAVGGILSQGKIGNDLPIAYTSRSLTDAEVNYSTIEKELLGIVNAVQQFRPYLYGRKFQIVTDHKPLLWLHNLKSPTSRLARWRERLHDFDYEMIHKPGRKNANADALSRNPVTSSAPYSNDDVEHEIGRVFFILRPATPESATPSAIMLCTGKTTAYRGCNSRSRPLFSTKMLPSRLTMQLRKTAPRRHRLTPPQARVGPARITKTTRPATLPPTSRTQRTKRRSRVVTRKEHDCSLPNPYSNALKTYEIGSISIPMNNNGIDSRSWEMISARLRETWPEEDAAKLTLCSGEITTPDVESRPPHNSRITRLRDRRPQGNN